MAEHTHTHTQLRQILKGCLRLTERGSGDCCWLLMPPSCLFGRHPWQMQRHRALCSMALGASAARTVLSMHSMLTMHGAQRGSCIKKGPAHPES